METVQFTNSLGQSVLFADAPFFIQSVEGLGEVKADLQSRKSAYEDGSTFIDAIFSEREIPLEFLIVADSNAQQTYGDISRMREHVASVLNPKLGTGVLKYENDRVVRLITCIAESVPSFPDSGGRVETIQSASVTFIAHDPYWRSQQIEEEPAFQPMFQFPFNTKFQMGIQRDERIIENDGNNAAPVKIEFFGPATNPSIINRTTKQFIKVNQVLKENECMVIDTNPDSASIVFVDAERNVRNVIHWLDIDSSLSTFRLTLGSNEIAYTADNDVQGATLNITWQKLYNAV